MKHSSAFGAVAACAVFWCISPVAAADFTSNSGKLYKNYRVIETTAQGVKIAHSEGLAYLLYSDLPYEVAGPYSADLQTRSGRVLKKYSVTKVSHKSLKILHDSGSSWIPHGELPEFLLKKYEKEIREEKARHEEKMKKMEAEAAKTASKPSYRTIDFAAQTKAFLTEAGLTEKEIKELNFLMAGASAINREIEQERQSRKRKSAGNSNPGSNTFFSRELPHVQYDPQEYARWKKMPRRWLPSKNDVLHVAIQVKNPARVAQMLEAGANPNILSSTGDTPLVYAIKEGQPDMIVLLLKSGADINGKTKGGSTPLFWSVITHNIGLCKVFIAKGADPNAGRNIWEWVLRYEDEEEAFKTAEVLASKGADCDTRNLIDLSGERLTRYCKLLYKENWQTKEAEVKRLQAEREHQRQAEEARRRQAMQNRGYGSGRICADCRGSGAREFRNNGRWIRVRCRSCGGSGNAGFAGDYISNGQRQRSQFDQMLGGMMGTSNSPGGIFEGCP